MIGGGMEADEVMCYASEDIVAGYLDHHYSN